MPEIHWQIMASQAVTFLIALAIVWKAAWKPLTAFIRDRQEKIRKTLADAEASKQSVAKLEADYRARLEQVDQKSTEIIAAARQEGVKVREEIVREAHREAVDLQRKSRDQLEADRQKIMKEMRSEIVGIAMAVAEKALQEPVPESVHGRKFQQILDSLSGRGAGRPS